MRKVLVTISYEVEPAKREAFLAHARAMREHARDVLKLDYQVCEEIDRPNSFTEVFACASEDDYESLDERQDEEFRDMIARLDRFTDLSLVRYAAIAPLA